MALYELFSHPVERGYRAGLCSKAALFLMLSAALTYIPPLLVAFRSHGEPARRPVRDAALRGDRAGFPDLDPSASRPFYLRVLAETEQLWGAADRALPAPGAARGLARTRARWFPSLEHVSRLQPAAGGSPARPARFGAWFPPGPSRPPVLGCGGDGGRGGRARRGRSPGPCVRGSPAWVWGSHEPTGSSVHKFTDPSLCLISWGANLLFHSTSPSRPPPQ